MSITFILFGIILILYLFGVLRSRTMTRSLCVMSLCGFVLLGYFFGDVHTQVLSINLCHLIAFLIMLFLCFSKGVFSKLHIVLLCVFLGVIALYFDNTYLLFYSGKLYFLLSSILLILLVDRRELFLSTLQVFTLFYLIVDGVFCYFELGTIFVDFDLVLLYTLFLYVLCNFFDYIKFRKVYFEGGAYANKKGYL